MATILIVEDDPAIREMLGFALLRDGYEFHEAGDTGQARQLMADAIPDLILLDWMLPGQSGFDFSRSLRRDARYRHIPVIMLTARDEEADKVAALEAGADDYVSKPFAVAELLARIKAILRRTRRTLDDEPVECGKLRLDPATHRVTVNDTPLELSPIEFRLLQFFMTHPDRVYSRPQLLDMVWCNQAYIEERTVDVHIRRLRMNLESSGHDRLIQTVRGAGYRFEPRALTR